MMALRLSSISMVLLSNSGSGPASIATNTLPFSIGAENTGGTPLQGRVDEVRIYNKALTETEIGQLYNNTSPFDGDTSAPYRADSSGGHPR